MDAEHLTGQRLLADVGGTHTRLALQDDGELFRNIETLENAKFSGLGEVLRFYLARHAAVANPDCAALAVATPVTGDAVVLTNLDWQISAAELCADLGLRKVQLVNDFAALARAVPVLAENEWLQIGKGRRVVDAAIGVIGPGTGLGVAAAVPKGGQWLILAGEGGHTSLAATTDEEAEVIKRLRLRFGHVSAERALSGPGLINLYQALGGSEASPLPRSVSDAALTGEDPVAVRALALFFALLGSAAGNLALTLGARGGIYLGGGILPRLLEPLRKSAFRERFEAKGRFRSYLQAIPTFVIVHPHPALLGLAELLNDPES